MAQAKNKLTKSILLKEMDDKLQQLNLIKSALEADRVHTQENLQKYQQMFAELFNVEKENKKGS